MCRIAAAGVLILVSLSCTSQAAPATATISPSPIPTPSPIVYGAPQYRALWVDAFHDGLKSQAQVEKLVADAHRANINALIVQVRKAGDAYFNKSDEPRATWGNRANDGSTSGYLDPGVPEVQIYTHRIFMDVARNYDVDGLHMDFVRYPGMTWGYNPNSVALYIQETGARVAPAFDDERWKAWRRARVTAFARDLHDDLKSEHPGVKLSGAMICFGGGPLTAADWPRTSAYSSVFQDWKDWLTKGYLDFGVPMNYDSDWDGLEQGWFGRWLNFEKDSGFGDRVVTGVGAFLNYPEETLAQINRVLAPSARGNHVLGVAIYSYGSTSVYGTDDFYGYPDLAAGLPRQPYSGGIKNQAALAQRARTFNDWFMTQLSQPDYYRDVKLGWVPTQPVFTLPAQVPPLH